jgi:hypothetical protein
VSGESKPRAPANRDLIPVGYTVAQTRKRMTRPLHSRAAILEAAEAVFAKPEGKPKT